MRLDWKNNQQDILDSGIVRMEEALLYDEPQIVITSDKGIPTDIIFCNFPRLRGEDVHLVNCVFEHCSNLHLEEAKLEECMLKHIDYLVLAECKSEGCVFDSIEYMDLVDSAVEESHFMNLQSNSEELISLERSDILHSTFENIELFDECYLCEGYGSALVAHSSFENIRTSREDGELFHCEEVRGILFKRKVEFSIIDELTCTGLDQVIIVEEE